MVRAYNMVTRCALWRVVRFYVDGFREMTSLGRTLWVVILIKLFIVFVILRVFFFRDPLANMNSAQRSDYVSEQLFNRMK